MAAYQEAVIASAPTHYYYMDDLTARLGTAMTLGGGTLTYAAGPNTWLGNCMVFNGSTFGVVPRTVTSDFTIEFFIKTTQSGSASGNWYSCTGVLGDEVSGNTTDLGVILSGTTIGLGMGGNDTLALGPAVNDGAWHHIAITRASGSVEFWKNGVLNNTATGQPTGDRGAGASFGVGAMTGSGTNYFIGSLDELAIYTRKLPGAEILNHYTVRADVNFYQVVG
jgi:hypothetical protein